MEVKVIEWTQKINLKKIKIQLFLTISINNSK
jgi:hypothetical protein